MIQWDVDKVIPQDFDSRLSQAFASHVWHYIDSGSRLSAFSASDPLQLLAHNLDFWLPHIYSVAERRIHDLGRVPYDDSKQADTLRKALEKCPTHMDINRPLYGGKIWMGETEARVATREMVEAADATGRLREIIDAVRSHRVEDDFSDQWSHAKEDFERKLYKKRSKVKVTFVELNDTIPVHGPESEVHENIIWEDLLALCDRKEKKIVVCLRSGITGACEISKVLGYTNHSPVSKALAKIRHKARKYLDL